VGGSATSAPKSLRGSEMTDVIFKGAEGRDAMGMAEVTITFEDPHGRSTGRTEIDIARRLTLDKESSYLLNGRTCASRTCATCCSTRASARAATR
jgi:chromosome segregation protein